MSFLNRRIMQSLGRTIVLMLLFAQTLSAATPCQAQYQTPAMAFDDMAGMDCAQKGNPNSCLQQCIDGDQSTNHVQIAFIDMPQVAVLTVPVASGRAVAPMRPAAHLARSPDPPPSIRFCSFQI